MGSVETSLDDEVEWGERWRGVWLPKAWGSRAAGVVLAVCLWWSDVCCSGFVERVPRGTRRGTLAAVREGATFGLRHDSRGRVGIWRGTPRRGLDSGLVQGGRSTPENIEDMPYHALCPAVLGPSPMAHPVSYPSPYRRSIDPFS